MPWNAGIKRRLKLRELEILIAVIQMGGMRKGADHLHMSQPAVSKAIADLEHTLGVALLDRGTDGVVPTAYGRALLKRGIAVFDELREGVLDIDFLSDPTRGEVRIGCTPLLASSFATAVVDRVLRRHPGVVFHLVTSQVEELHRELSERKVDLLIARGWGPIRDERLEFEFLFEDEWVVAAGEQHPLARRRHITLKELSRQQWVLQPSESAIGSAIGKAFKAAGLDYPQSAVLAVAPEARLSLVATGPFLTILPASALKFPAKRLGIKALPIKLPAELAPNGLVTLKNRTLGPVAGVFIDHARQIAKSSQSRNR